CSPPCRPPWSPPSSRPCDPASAAHRSFDDRHDKRDVYDRAWVHRAPRGFRDPTSSLNEASSMRLPKTTSLGIRTPSLPRLSLVSISSVAGTACTVAFWVLAVGAVLIPSAVLALKVFGTPVVTAGTGDEAIVIPLPWAYVLLVATAAFAYLATSALIFRLLIRIVATLRVGDPFHPQNVRRLHQIGAAFATVTLGVWVGQFLVA